MVLGNVTKIIPAQAVKFSRGGDELILTTDVLFKGTHTRDITNTRAGPIYTWEWVLRTIEVTVLLTEDLQTQSQADNALDANSALSFTNYTIDGLSISNIPADNVDDTYACALEDYENLAPESGKFTARLKLLILGVAS